MPFTNSHNVGRGPLRLPLRYTGFDQSAAMLDVFRRRARAPLGPRRQFSKPKPI